MGDDQLKPGTIVWRDLTVPDAKSLREFYTSVVGWSSQPADMGDYEDFSMLPAGGDEAVAGICHARGSNADLPAQWLIYVIVDDVEKSAARCEELGGKVLSGPRGMGEARFCVIRDPAGAVIALYAPDRSA